jgi:cobalamin biosynthesis Mg chelatase CobN
MTQGRKSKTARALGCLSAVLLALPVFAAVPASAQSGAESEYELTPNIPSANEGSGGTPSSGGGNGAGNADTSGAQPSSAVPALTSDSSDDGGAPILLILLAVVAAVCTAAAVWRLRQGPGSSDHESGPGAKPSTSATSETQSL